MATVIAGDVQYPLLPPVISCVYVVSHGISPGSINITTQVGKAIPPGIGNLRISDGAKGIIVHDCLIEYFSATQTGGQGMEWEFRMADERWRWRYSVVHGWYNQLDPHGKLIPSTVRSPAELAALCLRAMDVGRYTIDMPPGVTSDDARGQPDFLVTGVNFPAIGINPPCDWYGENAAASLSSLCDQCGRRIVYDPIARAVHIVRAGVGGVLPPGSISMQQTSITAPETPDAVAILGAPTRYQPLLKLQAVGKDWDGQIKPINALSYAPLAPRGRRRITVEVISLDDGFGGLPLYRFTVTVPNPPPGTSHTIEYQATAGETLESAAAALALFVTAALGAGFTVSVTGATITIESQNEANAFEVHTSEPGRLRISTGAGGGVGGVSWAYCQPPLFEGVRETTRLNLQQARALAQSCVFKMFRVVGVDCTTGRSPMIIPGYGKVFKRQNIILLDTKVEQIVPEGGDANFIDENEEALIVNLYDGFSRDQAGVVYGSVAKSLFDGITYVGDGALDETATETDLDDNTLETDRVPFSFSVDPTYQCIMFSNYVYKDGADGTVEEPTLYLQTAVNVRDEKTNQLVGYTDLRRIRNGNTVMVVKRPDVQLNVYGVYEQSIWSNTWRLTETKLMETDAITRARHYLNSTILQFQLKPGVVQKYNGIVPVPMDGRVTQVTYAVRGGQGCDTTVSLNGEHDVWTPPYPARRRAENLAAIDRVVPVGARSNMLDDGPEFYNARG